MSESADPAAGFELGMALLADPETAGEWRRAVALIEAAAAAGHPQASERCALFECMGVGRRPDWDKALDWLVTAAEGGSESAGRALILLADNRFVADLTEGEPWSALRTRISLAERLRAPAPRTLNARPLVLAIEGFASPAECQWLIAAAERRLEPAFVQDVASGRRSVDPNRTNTGAAFPIAEMDVIVELIRARISGALRVPPTNLEVTQVLHYSPGEEFRPHHDFLDPASPGFAAEVARNGQRAVTVLVYLNAGFEGGETQFPKLGIAYRGQAGDALVFANVDPAGAPDPATLHAGLAPTSGEKWILSQWVRDQPLGATSA